MKSKRNFITAFILVSALSLVMTPIAFCEATKKDEVVKKEGVVKEEKMDQKTGKMDLAKKENAEISEKEKEDVVIVSKQVSGTVSRIDGQSINVIYAVKEDAEYEIMIPYSKDLELRGYRSLKDIKAQDTVSLTYDEITKSKGKPEERREMALKEIGLIKNAVDGVLSSTGGSA